MKRELFFLSVCLGMFNAVAQVPTLQWQRALGGTEDDLGTAIIQTTDGGYITAGYAFSNDGNVTGNHGQEDFWVVKLNATGVVSWQKTYGGSGTDVATGIIQMADGGYVVSGYSESADGDVTGGHGYADFWIIKINSNGILQWQKTFGGSNPDLAEGIAPTADGGFILAGQTYSFDGDITENQYNGDAWIIKFDSNGVMQWQKSYGGSNYDRALSIRQTTDGGYIFAGSTYSNDGIVSGNHGNLDYWVVKINSTGVFQWQKTLGGSNEDEAKNIIQTSDGGFLVVGYITSSNGNITGYHNHYDAWVAKLNASGTLQWQRALGGTLEEKGFGVIEATDGGCYVLSSAQSRNGDLTLAEDGTGNYWMVKLNNLGVLQWQKTFGGSAWDEPRAFVKTTSGDFVITGMTDSNDRDVSGQHGVSTSDYWVVKLNGELGINDFATNSFKLYPNPTHTILHIENLNESIVSIQVTDVNGKVILEQSQNCQNINVENIAKGIYFLNIFSENNKYTTKFIKE